MKRFFYFTLILIAGITFCSSCVGNGGKGDADEDSTQVKIIELDSVSVPELTDKVYTVGDGTTMNVLELIGEKGDTIYIECASDAVTGGVNVGDEVAMTSVTTEGVLRIVTCINMTALEHLWTQKGADGHSQSLEIDNKGVAVTYGMSVDYDRWGLYGGKLLLYSPKQVASEQAEPCDTFDIMQLDDDKLVLSHGDLISEFDRDN